MTDDERDEGGRALAAVIIGPNVSWDVLSEAVRERYMRAYEAAGQVYERARADAERARGRCRECKRPVRFGQALCERCTLLNVRRVN